MTCVHARVYIHEHTHVHMYSVVLWHYCTCVHTCRCILFKFCVDKTFLHVHVDLGHTYCMYMCSVHTLYMYMYAVLL